MREKAKFHQISLKRQGKRQNQSGIIFHLDFFVFQLLRKCRNGLGGQKSMCEILKLSLGEFREVAGIISESI
jgi:hypothetical protein